MKKLSKDDLKLKGQVVTGLTDGYMPSCQDTNIITDCKTKDTNQQCKDTVRQCTFDTLQICRYTEIDSCNGNQTNYDDCVETDPCIADTISGGDICCDESQDTECVTCGAIAPSVDECPLTQDEQETCEHGPVFCGDTDVECEVGEETSDCD